MGAHPGGLYGCENKDFAGRGVCNLLKTKGLLIDLEQVFGRGIWKCVNMGDLAFSGAAGRAVFEDSRALIYLIAYIFNGCEGSRYLTIGHISRVLPTFPGERPLRLETQLR